jgi:hypothetical protein
MINLSDTDEHELSQAAEQQGKSKPEPKKWPVLQAELNEAVELWRKLEAEIAPQSPQDIQLQELKKLILEVKSKLASFDDF